MTDAALDDVREWTAEELADELADREAMYCAGAEWVYGSGFENGIVSSGPRGRFTLETNVADGPVYVFMGEEL